MSQEVGASLSFHLDTLRNSSRDSSVTHHGDASSAATAAGLLVAVGVVNPSLRALAPPPHTPHTHLRSYEHMGQASLTCPGGCNCSGIEGMQERRASQHHNHSIEATQVRGGGGGGGGRVNAAGTCWSRGCRGGATSAAVTHSSHQGHPGLRVAKSSRWGGGPGGSSRGVVMNRKREQQGGDVWRTKGCRGGGECRGATPAPYKGHHRGVYGCPSTGTSTASDRTVGTPSSRLWNMD